MLTLFSECHFWTLRDDVRVKPTDYGAFRYERSREVQQSDLEAQAKRGYIESRSGTIVLKNSKETGRLKKSVKKLEELLRTQRIVCAQWQDAEVVLMLFSSGLIAHICVDIYTGCILRMVFEKYFVGKLAAEVISDAFFTRSHIVLAYNTNQLTVVYLQKPNARAQGPEKIASMDPRIFHVLIPGTSERNLDRHVALSSSFDLFVIWTKSSQNEVYPWRPTLRDQDRANIHVFKLKGPQLESVSYCWTENDPLCVDFLRSAESRILTVEQKVSRKGDLFAEICSYEINTGKMQRTILTSIAMGTQICCYSFSPDQEKLFLGTIESCICLHDLVQQTTKFVTQIDIIPTHCSWHSDSSIIMIANDRSQFQCFDLALAPVSNQLQSEDVEPSILLDISQYFIVQPTLLHMDFSRKPDLVNFSQSYAQTDSFMLLLFKSGPICCLRFFSGAGMKGDIHNSGLTADVIVDKYLGLNQLEKAVNLLVALNWETYGAMCLISLHKIANYVFFRSNAKLTYIELMIKALKTFADTLSDETKDEFSDQVFDLKRRFFFFLLRSNYFSDAFEVAEDIEDYDLFMDLFNITKTNVNFEKLTASAFSHAAAILHGVEVENKNASNADDCNSGSSSHSSFSDLLAVESTVSVHIQAQQEKVRNVFKNYIPPLPSLKPKTLNAEMIKTNNPKFELRSTASQNRLRPLNSTSSYRKSEILSGGTSKKVSAINKVTHEYHSHHCASDQTNGISTVLNAPLNPYDPSTAHNILPRASKIASELLCSSPLPPDQRHLNMSTFLHYSAPAKTSTATEVLFSASQRTLQQIYQPKFYQHPLVSGTIPSTIKVMSNVLQDDFQKHLIKKPSASILSNGSFAQNNSIATTNSSTCQTMSFNNKEASGKNVVGEKNKVKFSDTVQVAVVPEIPRKEKPTLPKRNGYIRPSPRNITNPKKELADSLPLCHPNDDYLKDFNPLSTEEIPRPPTRPISKEELHSTSNKQPPPPPPSIKVVHFGIV